MAHVGTTTNLKQPAATGTSQRTGVWMAVFAAAVIAAIALAFVMTQLVGSKAATGSLASDRSDAQIEAQRDVTLSATFNHTATYLTPDAVDRRADAVGSRADGNSSYLGPNVLVRGADRGGSYLAPNVLDRGADRGGSYLAPNVLDRGADRGGSSQPVPGSIQLKHGFNRDLQP